MFKPVQMAKIAIMGLRKNQQTSVSILHDMEILQLEPLSKDVLDIVKNERDNSTHTSSHYCFYSVFIFFLWFCPK